MQKNVWQRRAFECYDADEERYGNPKEITYPYTQNIKRRTNNAELIHTDSAVRDFSRNGR